MFNFPKHWPAHYIDYVTHLSEEDFEEEIHTLMMQAYYINDPAIQAELTTMARVLIRYRDSRTPELGWPRPYQDMARVAVAQLDAEINEWVDLAKAHLHDQAALEEATEKLAELRKARRWFKSRYGV